MKPIAFRVVVPALAFFVVSGCSTAESRDSAPAMNGLYRCSMTSTRAIGTNGDIAPGEKYYRYFNVDVKGSSQLSIAYHPYPKENSLETRTDIKWDTSTFTVKDHSAGIFSKIRAWDGSSMCFFINPGPSHVAGLEKSMIDGEKACALSLSPSSGVYSAAVAALPEKGVCERISE